MKRFVSRHLLQAGRHLSLALAVVTLAALISACGGGGGGDPASGTSNRDTRAGADAGSRWQRIVPGGECQCADGSEFAFWERQADPTKVVFFLDGGGACFDATTCAFKQPGYDWNVHGDNPAEEGGIFDFARADNPFLHYSFIYVPSCTGDAHLGDATHRYSPKLTVEAQRLRQWHGGAPPPRRDLSRRHPGRRRREERRVGRRAVYGGLVADLLPAAHVTVFGAQSGHVPNDPHLNAEVLGKLWGAYANMPAWKVNEALTARDWGPPRFWIQTGLHDPKIVLARFDYAYDRVAAQEAPSLGIRPSNLLTVIDANEAAIETSGVVLHSYTAPGRGHGILEWPRFYEMHVNGVRLVDWVHALIAGQPPADVHCDECEASSETQD